MTLVQTNLRLSDTNRPDITTYLPPWIYVTGLTTSNLQNSIGTTVDEDPRVITRRDISGVDTMPGLVFSAKIRKYVLERIKPSYRKSSFGEVADACKEI
jgi:hypothetical protein